MKRRILAAMLAAPLAWLGCNGLLGIDDATFVPLAEAGPGSDVPTDPAGPIGPVRPSRTTIRVPAGDVRTIDVRIPSDTAAGITGIAKLAAVPSDPAITATVTQLEANHFTVTLTSASTIATFVDATVKLDAANLTDSSRTTATLRVLSGVPGSLDPTFGTDGRVDLPGTNESGNRESYPVAVADFTVVVGEDAQRLWVLDNDGKTPRTIELQTKVGGCSVDSLSTKDSGVELGGACGRDAGFSAVLDLASTQPPLLTETPYPVRGVAVTTNGVPTILLVRGNDGLLATVNQVPVVAATSPSSVFRVDNGVVVLGTASARFAIEYVAIGADGKGATPIVLDRVEANAAPIGVASGTSLGNETFAALWTVNYPTPPDQGDVAQLYVLGLDGGVHATKRFGALSARIAGDARGRIVMVKDDESPEQTSVARLLGDAGDDPSFPGAAIPDCSFPGLAVEPDGMLVVSCGKLGAAVISRYWP